VCGGVATASKAIDARAYGARTQSRKYSTVRWSSADQSVDVGLEAGELAIEFARELR